MQPSCYGKELISYEKINPGIAKRVLQAVSRHTWYLSEVLIGLAFFDRSIDFDTKALMVQALERPGLKDVGNRIEINLTLIPKQHIYDFITENTKKFFDILFSENKSSLPIDFLKLHPSKWYNNENYKNAENIARSLFVVNDVSERAVSLASKYNNKFIKKRGTKAAGISYS